MEVNRGKQGEAILLDRTGSGPTELKITVIYESVEAGKRAKRICDQLGAREIGDCVPRLDLWNFRVLSNRATRNAAATAAAAADLVILSMSGRSALPIAVERWVEMWLWLIDGRKPALVALFGVVHPEAVRIEAQLRKSAAERRIDFFSHSALAAVRPGATHPYSDHAKAIPASLATAI